MPSRADDGCLRYDLHTDLEDLRRFFLYEAWRDAAAWRAHMATDHLRGFVDRSTELTEAFDVRQLARV